MRWRDQRWAIGGSALLAAATWWATRPAWTFHGTPDSGRAGGFGSGLTTLPEITRDTMWTLTGIGGLIVLIVAYALRPDNTLRRNVWGGLCGLAQTVAMVRSPAIAVLLGCWTAVVATRHRSTATT